MANSFRSLVKSGLGLGVGLFLARILFVLVGLAFFVPGYTLYTKQKKEESLDILPLLLMGIGVVVMGGAGFEILLGASGDLFD
jgi:uncharacterized membrane protein YhaH (DUF805 family)